ncbi:magnesium transporter CorA family protein [Anoxybacteroides tepidamans]|uniref:magnesium transporter CorA family protein n=1 Tax=Anoxybacteroides tepidamans TaxID=265948 RepID=UPI000686FE09|nr:magnesium transporter CorA family protein [Anoxybacillus tepidamans]
MSNSESSKVCWLHFNENSKDELQIMLKQMNVHPLAQQLLLLGSDFPKIDVYDDCIFVSLAFVQSDWRISRLQLIVTKQHVISYAKDDAPIVEKIKDKLFHHLEHSSSPDFVLYEFFEVLTFHFLRIIDDISDHIQTLEKQVFKTPFENDIGHSVYRWKIKLHELRQIIEAQEEMMKVLHHPKFPYIGEEVRPYLQDVTSRFARITAALDTLKETLSGIFDLQLSLKSDHMNVIMKTLTLVSVIFMPMTFVAGVYGMNFKLMPELAWKYGYAYALVLMIGLGISIAFYFKKKGWW